MIYLIQALFATTFIPQKILNDNNLNKPGCTTGIQGKINVVRTLHTKLVRIYLPSADVSELFSHILVQTLSSC